MTPFKSALSICGLSQTEAASFFGVRLDTVKSWCAGRNEPPAGAWNQLRKLYNKMLDSAEDAAEVINESPVDQIQWMPGERMADWPSESAALTVFTMAALIANKPVVNSES